MACHSIVQLIFLGKIIMRSTKREESAVYLILWFVHTYCSPCMVAMHGEKCSEIKKGTWIKLSTVGFIEATGQLPSTWSHLLSPNCSSGNKINNTDKSHVLFLKTKMELGQLIRPDKNTKKFLITQDKSLVISSTPIYCNTAYLVIFCILVYVFPLTE